MIKSIRLSIIILSRISILTAIKTCISLRLSVSDDQYKLKLALPRLQFSKKSS